MLSTFGASESGFRFGLALGAWVFYWACLFFGPGKWVCAPIFQTLSVVVMKVEVLVDEVRQPS